MDTKKLCQKIIDLAIWGKLVPQDPNDEPASVLLGRIQAEKERLIKEGKIKRNKKAVADTVPHDNNVPFVIPESWEWIRLEDFVYAVTDGDHQPPPQSLTGVPFLVISDVNTGQIVFDKARFVDEQYYDSLPLNRKAEKGDILFTVTGSYGIVIPVKTEDKFCFQRHIGLIKTFDCTQWLTLVLQSNYVRSYCNKVATGTAQKTVSLGHLRDLFIPIPPVDEQIKIVKMVNSWILVIDQIIKDTSDLTSAIAIARSKILDLAIHGKLVPQDPNDEPAIELLRRTNSKFEPCGLSRDFGIIPDNWCLSSLKSVCTDFIVPQRDKPTRFDGNIPWCRIEDIEGKYLNGSLSNQNVSMDLIKEMNMRICPVGTVICSCSASLGVQAITTVPCCTNQTFIGIVPKREILQEDYLFYYLKSQTKLFYDLGTGTTIKYISRTKFENLIIPLPPKNEQCRIVAKIEKLFALLDDIKESLEA